MSDLYEKYPHVYKKVTGLWGTAECRKYLLELIADSKNGLRKGFSMEHGIQIIELLNKHDVAFPDLDDTYHIVQDTFYSVSPKAPIERKRDEFSWGFPVIVIFAIICAVSIIKHH